MPAKLLVPKDEARDLIRERITEGRVIQYKSRRITSDHELDSQERAFEKWRRVNVHMLLRMFDDRSVADEYDESYGVAVHRDLEGKIGAFQREVYDWMNRLESIEESLRYYAVAVPEPVPVLEAAPIEQPVRSSTPPPRHNPWISGSFYIFLFIVVVATISVTANNVPAFVLPIVLISGVLFVLIVGVLQLRNDRALKDRSFVEVVKEVLKRIPLLGKLVQSDETA